METEPFCHRFSPGLDGLRLLYKTPDPLFAESFDPATGLGWLSAAGTPATATSYMYAGSTPQRGGRRSAFVGPMGDGRAAVVGAVATSAGEEWVVLAKGLRTPITEPGKDGLLSVEEAISELVASELAAAAAVPASRVLALYAAPGRVARRGRAATARVIMLRAAPQWWRCGTVEFLYYTDAYSTLRELVHSCRRAGHCALAPAGATHAEAPPPGSSDPWPENEAEWCRLDAAELRRWTDREAAAASTADADAAAELLRGAVERTARLAALWEGSGFLHGMLRSDNVALCGVAIDLGTARFLRCAVGVGLWLRRTGFCIIIG